MARPPNIFNSRALSRVLLAGIIALGVNSPNAAAQQPATPPQQSTPPSDKKEPELPAQIELLETRVRFESNGDSRKEVHTTVHINNELGAHQFARISFDYNRSFQQIEFPLLRITHAGGGTAEILPSAVADQPNPAVADAPAYQDVRIKSVRLLGLAPGDTIEYRVATTARAAPFLYFSHDFSRGGVVSRETLEIDLPGDTQLRPAVSSNAANYMAKKTEENQDTRQLYFWEFSGSGEKHDSRSGSVDGKFLEPAMAKAQSDVVLTRLAWTDFLIPVRKALDASAADLVTLRNKAEQITQQADSPEKRLLVLYRFVSKIRTIPLPLGATGFRLRSAGNTLQSGYGVAEDKSVLLSALASSIGIDAAPALVVRDQETFAQAASSDAFVGALNVARLNGRTIWLDSASEVAPFGMIGSSLRGKPALLASPPNDVQFFEKVSEVLPFNARQGVDVSAAITSTGILSAKVKYEMRGDNELTLRLAFHQSPREKWPELAQLLALGDGFRGKITHVTASDPYLTETPFRVEYEITQPKFVDWSRKPVRIPALLPQIALPDLPGRARDSKPGTIDLGTPLAIETHLTLHLPPGTTAQSPTGTAVVRDYAKFDSRYDTASQTVTAERRLSFLERTIPADRAADYNAFLRAVQNDEAQEFTFQRSETENTADSKATAVTPKPPK